MSMKFAVVVQGPFEDPWTEYMADTEQEAWDRRQFIEAHLRGVKVQIRKITWGEDEEYG